MLIFYAHVAVVVVVIDNAALPQCYHYNWKQLTQLIAAALWRAK